MDSLSGNIFALEVALFDSFGDLRKVHWLTGVVQNDVNFIADIFGVDHWPLGEPPATVQISNALRDTGQGLYVLRVGIIDLLGNGSYISWFADIFNSVDNFVDAVADGFFGVLRRQADSVEKVIVVVYYGDPRAQI